MKKIFKKVNETGTLLVEAMAMLGLIAMVTPVLYKKASERTVELQDVNASAQMRALSTAIDGYLKDNFARITKGEKITDSAGHELDFSGFKNAAEGQVGPVSITHFGDYLPYGFLKADGTPRETKIFDDEYNVIIKLESDIQGGKVLSQTLTGFVTATPKIPDEIGSVRASRIASMIGSNGGYVTTEGTEQVAMGAQGIWSVPTSELGGGLVDNSFVVSSVQPISSQGLANEDVLHRKNESDAADELNTMETDLFMGYTVGDTRNIRLVNQIIMHPNVDRMVKGADVASTREEDIPADTLDPAGFGNTLDKALYIAKGGGAYVEGALQAMNSLFTVKDDGIKYFATTNVEGPLDPATGTKPITTKRADKPVFKVASDEMVYGDPGAGKTKLTVKSAGSMTFGTSAVPANGTTPAQPEGETLYADKDKFRAGDGNLNVIKDGTDWYTVINKDAEGNATAHEGERSTYTWNGAVPTEDTNKKPGKYEVSINGSAFVKDTMLTGKLKSFNVDAATLRAGVDPNDFDGASEDTDFYTVARRIKLEDGSYRGSFIVGTERMPVLRISDKKYTDDKGRLIPEGVTLSAFEDQSNAAYGRGIDITAGYDEDRLKFLDFVYPTLRMSGYTSEAPNYAYPNYSAWSLAGGNNGNPHSNAIRVGATGGVYLSSYDLDNSMHRYQSAPVAIQGNTFQAYWVDDFQKSIIDMYTDEILMAPGSRTHMYRQNPNLINYARRNRFPTNTNVVPGKVMIADSNFIITNVSGIPVVDIFPSFAENEPGARFMGGFAIYDSGYDMRTAADREDANISGDVEGHEAALLVDKGKFEIRSTITDESRDIEKNDKLLVVDSHQNGTYVPDNAESHGSVYIRKGAIALASNYPISSGTPAEGDNRNLTNAVIDSQYGDKKDAVGYIAADRFISHYQPSALLSDRSLPDYEHYVYGGSSAGGSKNAEYYDGYEINPAYTSVMHDIKLTTRGGARLSDILPDFINKGIYVIDTTYKPGTKWTPGSQGIPDIRNDEWTEENATAEKEVSPYAGFIPTPKCPPGYSKTITLTPSGWKMAEAGDVVGDDVVARTNIEEYKIDPTVPTEDDRAPLYFQKNTWLKAMVLPYYGDTSNGKFYEEGQKDAEFMGWGAVMGFIYPYAYWADSVDYLNPGVVDMQDGSTDSNDVYWNLFPVYYKQIEGYATVYCYFDRKSFKNYKEVYHDYDQLKALTAGDLSSYKKTEDSATEYIDRLNDPKLKYYDPW